MSTSSSSAVAFNSQECKLVQHSTCGTSDRTCTLAGTEQRSHSITRSTLEHDCLAHAQHPSPLTRRDACFRACHESKRQKSPHVLNPPAHAWQRRTWIHSATQSQTDPNSFNRPAAPHFTNKPHRSCAGRLRQGFAMFRMPVEI